VVAATLETGETGETGQAEQTEQAPKACLVAVVVTRVGGWTAHRRHRLLDCAGLHVERGRRSGLSVRRANRQHHTDRDEKE